MEEKMKHFRVMSWLVALGLVAFMIDGCKTDDKKDGMKPPFGGEEDMSRAADLWSAMEGYRSWNSY
ncbi:MAG: hypothetical protein V3T76_00460, partial [candidate division NC10 bacterium]